MANQMIQDHKDDLGTFFTEHPKGKMLPEFFDRASNNIKREKGDLLGEIEKISQNVNLMQDIIETQQTIAKLGSSKTQDLIDVVYEALRVNSQLLEEHQVHIERSFLTGKPVQAQRAKLVHILINLIKNAIEAMLHKTPEERQLFIGTGENEDGWVYLSIRDTGCGIKPENRDKMFSHGFTTKDHGHGFGLSYCAKAVEEMGGQIAVESDGEDQGTTFLLSFPPIPHRLD
jgi:signal transduction histidine kinase